MVSAKKRDDSNKRQQLKRKLDVGSENEEKRKEKDRIRKKGKKNSRKRENLYICLRDILNKPVPARKSICLSLVFIGGNKFVDINGEWIEVLYAGDKTLKNCINNKIKLFDPVTLHGSLRYKKNSINNDIFDFFHIINYYTGNLYYVGKPETILYADALLKEKDLTSTEILMSKFKPFTSLTDLNMCSNWKKPRSNQSNMFVELHYKRFTGINTIVPILID